MDAFFVAVEVRRRPELAGLPVIVGGNGERGVVAAASYEARRFGVHSAMPSVQARRRCPDAVFLPGDHALYAEVSRAVHAILLAFTPLVEPIALDEAFMDVTGSLRLFGSAAEIGAAIRDRVRDELNLACSVGVAPSKLIAKLASESAKPVASASGVTPGRAVVEITAGEALAFLHAHPVQALWGVGPKTLEKLRRMGVHTIGDLAEVGEQTLIATLGRANGRHLHQLALGIDERPVVSDRDPRSIGHEETFAADRHGRAELQNDLVRLADSVASRLRAAGLCARTIQVKLRFDDFATISRSVTLPSPVDDTRSVLRAASDLLDAVDFRSGVRLLGVSGANFASDARQLSLDDIGPEAARVEAASAVDEIRERFGRDSIAPASLLGSSGLAVHRPGMQQWGPSSSPQTLAEPMERGTTRVVPPQDV
jgi:DNA polymerase-4